MKPIIGRQRLIIALSAYAILALIAAFELEGFLRAVVLFFFALLAGKTLAHADDQPMQ